jgi:phosphoribosyl 1,2-cyclic phosphate phosphodiesterase
MCNYHSCPFTIEGGIHMKITFLGTAAAEGIPSPFCDCPTCEHARAEGGRNLRRRQSFLINDDLLVDIGPDLFASCAQHGISLVPLRYLLVTHNHLDHFAASNLQLRAKPFRLATELKEMAMVAGPSVLASWELSGGSDRQSGIRRIPFLPGRSVELHPYSVTSLTAVHNGSIGDAMNYIIDDGGKKILIASDTGLYGDSVWEQLNEHRFDSVIYEATLLKVDPGKEHMNRSDLLLMVRKMRELGCINASTTLTATHFSHQSVGPHQETEALLAQDGIICAYDGMTLNI